MVRTLVVWVLLANSLGGQTTVPLDDPRAVFDRAVKDFRQSRVVESAAGFDRLVSMMPESMPQLWQRGIVLYYAGRLDDCRDQFESHRTVNSNDVEVAAWHFLCVARAESPVVARSSLLPVGPDSRVPMRQIYDLFAGRATADEVMSATDARTESEFYANLYIGLHAEALGNKDLALRHMRAAARDEFARVGGYMHMVARVHLAVRGKR